MTISIVVTAEGFENAKRRLGNINKEKLVRGSKFFMRKRVEEADDDIRSEAPVGATQELRSSIRTQVEDTSDAIHAVIIADAPHARWVHEGTGVFGPHKQPIRPQRAKFLQFFKDGRWIRARSIQGQPSNPFLRRGAERLRSTIQSTLPQDIRRAVRVVVAGGG